MKISIFDSFFQFNDDAHAFTQEIRTIKNFTEFRKCSPANQEAVLNVEINVTKLNHFDKFKVPSINYPYFPKLFRFFVVKLTLLRKSSDCLLLGVTNITLVLRFMKSNESHYVQTVKVAVVKGSNFAHTVMNFSPFFKFFFSSVISSYK